MTKKLLPVLMLSLMPLLSHAVWVDSKGKPLPDKPSRQTLGTFGTQVMMVASEKRLDEQWKALPLPTKIDKVTSVKRGDTVYAALFFFGCEANKEGKCDVISQFTLLPPNGAKMPPVAGQAWSAAAPPKEVAQLSPIRMKIVLDDTDPAGTYEVEAKVKDRVSGKLSTIKTSFTLKTK
jgi:hypothetical protein